MFPRRKLLHVATYLVLSVAALLLGIWFLLNPASTARAQSQPEALGSVSGTVRSGTVRDEGGNPLPNVSVVLQQFTNAQNYPQRTVTSDAAGNYLFSSVFPGIYIVSNEAAPRQ